MGLLKPTERFILPTIAWAFDETVFTFSHQDNLVVMAIPRSLNSVTLDKNIIINGVVKIYFYFTAYWHEFTF